MMGLLLLLLLVLPAHVWATTYWVSGSLGSSGNCGNSQGSTPPANYLRTIQGSLACLSAGDTLNIRAGTYVEALDFSVMNSGTSSSQITITKYQAEAVTVKPSSASCAPAGTQGAFIGNGRHDITIQNLTFNFTNCLGSGFGFNIYTGANRITFINNDIFGGQGDCSLGGGGGLIDARDNTTNFITIRGGKVHDFGCSIFENGIYLVGSNNLVDGVEIYGISGSGFQAYGHGLPGGSSNSIYRNMYIHDNECGGLAVTNGDNNVSYNNVIVNNYGGNAECTSGIKGGLGGVNNQFYNNTVVGAPLGFYISGGANNTIFRNNIITGASTPILASGTGTVYSNNLCDIAYANCAVVGNPKFVGAIGGNYRISAIGGSPAIGQGVNLNSVFTTDYDGTVRGSTWDIGAFQASGSPQPDPVNLLAHWPLTEGSGTTATDTSGNNHQGTLDSAAWASPGITGPSAFAPTGTQEITVSNLTGLSVPTSCSISAWINMSTSDLAGCTVLSNREGCSLYVSSAGLTECWIYTGSQLFVARGLTNVLDGANHHLICSYDAGDGSGLRGYVDLAQVASTPLTSTISYAFPNGAFRMGRDGAVFGDYQCHGKMNAVYLYQGRLTAEGRENLYNEQVPANNLSVTHVGWFAANAPEGVSVGAIDTNLDQLISAPIGVRWSIHKADAGTLTEYFRPFCRVLDALGNLVLDWTEITNSFGSTGIRFYADSLVTTGTPTSVLLPTEGFTAAPGLYVDNPVDITSPYDAGQRMTLGQSGHEELEMKIEFGSPRAATERVECRPHRENGTPFTSYMGNAP